MTGGEQSKQEKHIKFDETIDGLQKELNSLGSLVDRVRGAHSKESEKTDGPKGPNISLSEFIVKGADRIENIRSQLNEYKTALRELLF